jgi:hypothetical protein
MGETPEAHEHALTQPMKAVCVRSFGGPEVMVYEELPLPSPAEGQVLPLIKARLAHVMLTGKPHKRGKIVLTVDA